MVYEQHFHISTGKKKAQQIYEISAPRYDLLTIVTITISFYISARSHLKFSLNNRNYTAAYLEYRAVLHGLSKVALVVTYCLKILRFAFQISSAGNQYKQWLYFSLRPIFYTQKTVQHISQHRKFTIRTYSRNNLLVWSGEAIGWPA